MHDKAKFDVMSIDQVNLGVSHHLPKTLEILEGGM